MPLFTLDKIVLLTTTPVGESAVMGMCIVIATAVQFTVKENLDPPDQAAPTHDKQNATQ